MFWSVSHLKPIQRLTLACISAIWQGVCTMDGIVRDFYDREHEAKISKPAVSSSGGWSAYRLLHLALRHARPEVVLEVGCGSGDTLSSLVGVPELGRLIGVDPSEPALAEAKKRIPQCEFVQGYAEAMGTVPDASCTMVFLQSVFEHVFDVNRAMNEINRILRPGGVCAIYTTDFNWLKKILICGFMFERYFSLYEGHIRFFTGRSLRRAMNEHGFQRVEYEWAASYFGVMPAGQNAVFKKINDVKREAIVGSGTV